MVCTLNVCACKYMYLLVHVCKVGVLDIYVHVYVIDCKYLYSMLYMYVSHCLRVHWNCKY